MKKVLLSLVMLTLVIPMAFLFVGCTDNGKTTSDNTQNIWGAWKVTMAGDEDDKQRVVEMFYVFNPDFTLVYGYLSDSKYKKGEIDWQEYYQTGRWQIAGDTFTVVTFDSDGKDYIAVGKLTINENSLKLAMFADSKETVFTRI